ncbi:protease complex subunit PrcB family protein [Clostridiaceae bacterium M8S5]|nr:protease complex subunit PrcB family protein [Clostridiaceae bacterium M8S5]
MKKYMILGIAAIIVMGAVFVPRFMHKGDENVKFTTLTEEQIPQQIMNVLPRYIAKERALSCRIDNSVYVIVTRGEKRSSGFMVEIDKITQSVVDNKHVMTVHALYKDPTPDQVVNPVITYPYVVTKTKLSKLPDKIKLKVEYKK